MSSAEKPLSEKPLGYILAVLGGFLGGPLGLVLSPAVLFGLGKVMKAKDGKTPNRFLVWAAAGVVGVPLSLAPIISQSDMATREPGASQVQTSDNQSDVAEREPSSSEKKSSDGRSLIPLGVKENVRNDRAVRVTRSRELGSISVSNQFMDPISPKGGKLVAVYMEIENTGKKSGNMFWTKFQLRDSEDRVYNSIEDFTELMTLNMWVEEQGLEDTGNQLFPGATADTVSVFRVAPDAAGLKLVVARNEFAIE